MHYPGDVDADPAPGGQESPPGRPGLPWPRPGDGDQPVAAGTPGEPYAAGYGGADRGWRVTGSGHAGSGYGDGGYGDSGYDDSYGSGGYGSGGGAPHQGAATPGEAAAARILYGAAGGTAGKGPVRGFPPAPGQSAPVYPAGQFSAWNTSPAGTRPGRPDGSAGRDAWPVAASAEHGYAEPDYSVLAVSDPAADATATQTWAVVDDRMAGGWQDPGARGDAPPGEPACPGPAGPGSVSPRPAGPGPAGRRMTGPEPAAAPAVTSRGSPRPPRRRPRPRPPPRPPPPSPRPPRPPPPRPPPPRPPPPRPPPPRLRRQPAPMRPPAAARARHARMLRARRTMRRRGGPRARLVTRRDGLGGQHGGDADASPRSGAASCSRPQWR